MPKKPQLSSTKGPEVKVVHFFDRPVIAALFSPVAGKVRFNSERGVSWANHCVQGDGGGCPEVWR